MLSQIQSRSRRVRAAAPGAGPFYDRKGLHADRVQESVRRARRLRLHRGQSDRLRAEVALGRSQD